MILKRYVGDFTCKEWFKKKTLDLHIIAGKSERMCEIGCKKMSIYRMRA